MSGQQINVHVLDAAYKPFPAFEEWASKTSVDTVRWERYNAALKNRRGISAEALKRAREVVKRAAALDTGAIEGFTRLIAGSHLGLRLRQRHGKLKLAEKGEQVRSLFEAQMQAYDYVLDLATKSEPITEAAIRKLHEVVCGAQDTYRVITAIGFQEQALPKGRYKVSPEPCASTREREDPLLRTGGCNDS